MGPRYGGDDAADSPHAGKPALGSPARHHIERRRFGYTNNCSKARGPSADLCDRRHVCPFNVGTMRSAWQAAQRRLPD